MQAVINAVRDFLPHLRSRVLHLMCDNAETVAPGVKLILITPLQETASWFPEVLDLSQEDPKKGHSREAAQMMSRSLRESSLHVYESHWARFVSCCRSKRWHVFRVRSHHFSTYMMHLFRDGLLPSTIISHRTSVAYVLCHWVYDPAANPHIKLLIRAFWLERPVQHRIMPKWDLHLVLLALMRPPFASESDEQDKTSDDIIPLKWQTMKTVFMLALASVSRRSYIHALSVAPGRCVFSRGNTQRQLVVSLL